MPEVVLGCSDSLVVEKTKDMMENIIGGEQPIAWYG
jgi:hypothetical protein